MSAASSAAGITRRTFLVLLALPAWMRTPAPAQAAPWPAAQASELDSVPRADFLRHHAFSLDNFLESRPGGLLVRAGPIGYEARYSRWGIGRGRARLLANGIVLNDPQNDVAPLAHTATSGLGWLAFGESARSGAAPWIEGGLYLDDLPAPTERPHTFVELSKGTNDLRQRRVRFCSEEGIVGIDLGYDEVLDDGYMFDAGGEVVLGPDYGRARSRNVALAVRGSPDEDTGYALGVRRFQSTTTGDLTTAANQGTHDGHLVWMEGRASGARLLAYGRGYTSSHPDSATTNETVGGVLAWDARAARLVARVEHTRSTVDVGATANPSLTQGTLTADGGWRLAPALSLRADASVAGDYETALAWGASGAIRWSAGPNAVVARAMRAFRMPNLGERYLPSHPRDGLTLAGDPDLDPETAIEAGVDWEVRGGGIVNRVRAAWIRSAGTIAFRIPSSGAPGERRAANAPDDRTMTFVEERADAEFAMGPLRVRAGGSLVYADGEREEAFASVPKIMATATALFGGEMFERTSALYLGGEFVHVDERRDYAGTALPAFDVLNLLLEGRLLDARLYLKYVNVLDEQYRTEGDYLMTPATFVYGIEWTLFD